MQITDSKRLDFLEKWEISIYENTRFTLLTQHVRRDTCKTLREFCDHGIYLESMLDQNGLDVMAWHFLPPHLQEMVASIWEKESRPLTDEEKSTLQEEADKYWEELHQTEEDNADK